MCGVMEDGGGRLRDECKACRLSVIVTDAGDVYSCRGSTRCHVISEIARDVCGRRESTRDKVVSEIAGGPAGDACGRRGWIREVI
jgi:hypothetical protein